MQGLGCAVAADKGEVPVLLMMHYIGIHDEDKERQETKAVKNSASHPATLAGLFMQHYFPGLQMFTQSTSKSSHMELLNHLRSVSTHHVRTVSIRRCRSLFLHEPLAGRAGLTSQTPTFILPSHNTSRDPIDFGLLKH